MTNTERPATVVHLRWTDAPSRLDTLWIPPEQVDAFLAAVRRQEHAPLSSDLAALATTLCNQHPRGRPLCVPDPSFSIRTRQDLAWGASALAPDRLRTQWLVGPVAGDRLGSWVLPTWTPSAPTAGWHRPQVKVTRPPALRAVSRPPHPLGARRSGPRLNGRVR